jgi:surfeit locus 1 family protein
VFAPTPGFTLLTLVVVVAFVKLGFWQWGRGSAREAAQQSFEHGAAAQVDLGGRALTDVAAFQRVRVVGQLDAAHQFLLDNRSYQGRPGYEVLTPLRRPGSLTLLVDRGWLPFTGSRAHLPAVDFSAPAPLTLSGRAGTLPSPGLALGRAPPPPGSAWPKLTSYPDMQQLAQALGESLDARVLLLDPQAPMGFVRDWHSPGLPPLRHFSYAVQWWSFAALAFGAWALFSRRNVEPAT